jgi:hypothetical protein
MLIHFSFKLKQRSDDVTVKIPSIMQDSWPKAQFRINLPRKSGR